MLRPSMRDAIERREPGLLTYGLTPPKSSYPADKRARVARKQAARIEQLPIDGLVVYDLQDESGRTSQARPFPFVQTIDPVDYAYGDLGAVEVPKIVYRCVAPLSEPSLLSSLGRIEHNQGLSVLVGAASRQQTIVTRLSQAYAARQQQLSTLPVGGVLIAERHRSHGGEHDRVLKKMEQGCSFFITQAVYSVVESKDVLSDLYYRAQQLEVPLPPIFITLSPCGSTKTMEFMRWLGISVPRWLDNELTHAQDILGRSVEVCADILADLADFARDKQIPLGCNIESVSLRRAEIEASVELVHRARTILEPLRAPSA